MGVCMMVVVVVGGSGIVVSTGSKMGVWVVVVVVAGGSGVIPCKQTLFVISFGLCFFFLFFFQKIEKIIERDFFPDLPKLSVQKSYFDALEQNDLVKLRELQMKYGGTCPTTGRLSTACKIMFCIFSIIVAVKMAC